MAVVRFHRCGEGLLRTPTYLDRCSGVGNLEASLINSLAKGIDFVLVSLQCLGGRIPVHDRRKSRLKRINEMIKGCGNARSKGRRLNPSVVIVCGVKE